MQMPPNLPDTSSGNSSGNRSDRPPGNSLKNIPKKTPKDTPHPQWTILKILRWTTSFFNSHAIDSPRLTAEVLLAHILKIRRLDLYLRFDQPLNGQELSLFREVVKRRAAREPVAYITGNREFWGIDFTVTPDVLIPRPETEFLVEESLKLIPVDVALRQFRVLDVGTGSGAVIIALAVNRPGHLYFASDISQKSISIASANASQNRVKADIRFLVGELFSPVNANGERPDNQKFDLIISNPPYIPSADIAGLAPEVGRYEPLRALDGGAGGLDIMEKIIHDAPNVLKKHGFLMIEIGYDQKEQMTQLVSDDGRFTAPVFIRDYGGHDRVAKMRLK